MQPNFKRFGERLDRHIKNSIYKQAEVARLMEYDPSTVNKWVKGTNRMSVKAINKFCDLLNLGEEDRQELLYLANKSTEDMEDIVNLETAGENTNKVNRDVPVDREEQTKIRRARRRRSIVLAQALFTLIFMISIIIIGLLNIPQMRGRIYALVVGTTTSDPIATRTSQSTASPTLPHASVVATPTTFTVTELKATAQSLRVCGNARLPNGGFLRESPELLEEKSSQSNVMVNIPGGSNVEILCESLQRLDQSSSGEIYVKIRYRSAEGWIWIKSLVLNDPALLAESFEDLVQGSQTEFSNLEKTIQALSPQASIPPTPEALIDVERNQVIVVYEDSGETAEIVGLIPGNSLRLWNICGSVNGRYAISSESCESIFGWINDPTP